MSILRPGADRCLETSTTTGTGPFTLLGAVNGYQAIGDEYATDEGFGCTIEGLDGDGQLNGQWVTCEAHLNGAGALVVDDLFETSNGGAAVSFSAASLRIFVSLTEEGLEEWLTTTGFVTAVTGSGGLSSSGGTTPAISIANSGVTYAKIQNVSATDKLLGRSSAGAGVVEEIALTSAGRALIADADASAQRTTLGLGTLATQNGTFADALLAANNLSDVANASTARTNLGLGSLATQSGTFSDAMLTANNLSDVASAATSRTNLGLGTIATQNANNVAVTGGSITGMSTPSASSDVATKGYVDGLTVGLSWKTSVKAATTTALTLASDFENGDTIDGVVISTGDRILIKDQANAENGIYTVNASGSPTRSADGDSESELISAAVFVQQGTVNADKAFVCTNDAITIGVTTIVFVAFSSASGALIAANNLSDLASASTARTNLGLGTLATQSGTFANAMMKDGSNGPTTGAWTFLDGTDAAPALRFSSNTTGGLWRASIADNVLGDGFAGVVLDGGVDDYVILKAGFVGMSGIFSTFTATRSTTVSVGVVQMDDTATPSGALLGYDGTLTLRQATGASTAMLLLKDHANTEEWSLLAGPTSVAMRFGRNMSINAIGAATTLTFDSTDVIMFMDYTANKVAVGGSTTTSLFNVGASAEFQVDTAGNIVKLRGQTTTFPAANASGVLTNNGSGTLSWAAAGGGMSIGGTVTSATVGSIFFAATGPALEQDNANFFWDNSSKRLGIGTASPETILHLKQTNAGGVGPRLYLDNPGVDTTNSECNIVFATAAGYDPVTNPAGVVRVVTTNGGNGDTQMSFSTYQSGTHKRLILDGTTNTTTWSTDSVDTTLTLNVGASFAMRLTSAGKVRVGNSGTQQGDFNVATTNASAGAFLVIQNTAGSNLNQFCELTFLNEGLATAAGVAEARVRSTITNAGNGASNLTLHTWDGAAEAVRLAIAANGDALFTNTVGIRGVAYTWPASNASGVLTNNGSGTLSWAAASTGDVVGPGSATDNAIARYDTTTGKLLQGSTVSIADGAAAVTFSSGFDRDASGTYAIGGTNITTLSLGRATQLTSVLGDFQVAETATFIDIVATSTMLCSSGFQIQVGAGATGLAIGTSSTDKMGFWGATAVVQQSHVNDPSGGATVDSESRTAIASILNILEATGFMAP